jgi:hypothetical protein
LFLQRVLLITILPLPSKEPISTHFITPSGFVGYKRKRTDFELEILQLRELGLIEVLLFV